VGLGPGAGQLKAPSMALFAALDLPARHLAGIDQGIDASLGQGLDVLGRALRGLGGDADPGVSGSRQWLKGFQAPFRAELRLDAVLRLCELVRLCVVFFEVVFFEVVFFEVVVFAVLLELVLRRRLAWAWVISPASTRAATHILESFFTERDMQARKPSLPTA